MSDWPWAARIAAALIVGTFGALMFTVGLWLVTESSDRLPRRVEGGRIVWGGRWKR